MTKTLEQALKGDEAALIDMTYLIENNELLYEDLHTLTTHKASSETPLKYLRACLYLYGAPGIQPDYKKSKALLKALIREDDFSYAKYLLYELSVKAERNADSDSSFFMGKNKDKDSSEYRMKLLDEASRAVNPLATWDLFAATYFQKSVLSNLEDLSKDISLFSIALQQLAATKYRAQSISALNQLKEALDSMLEKMEDMRVIFASRKQIPGASFYSLPEGYDKKLTKPAAKTGLAKAWVAVANHHKAVNQRYLMFDALQKAYAIKPKESIKNQWLEELGGINSFKELWQYFKFVGELVNVAMKRIPAIGMTDQTAQQFHTTLFNLDVENKNLDKLFEVFSGKMSPTQAKEFHELRENIGTQYVMLERDINKRSEGLDAHTSLSRPSFHS